MLLLKSPLLSAFIEPTNGKEHVNKTFKVGKLEAGQPSIAKSKHNGCYNVRLDRKHESCFVIVIGKLGPLIFNDVLI